MKQKIILLSFFLCLYFLSQAQKQSIEVSGKVTDSITGEPVSHATISIKGEGDKAYTDDKGTFRFKATARYPIILRITYQGFESKEVEFIKDGSELSITLKPGGTMDEVVVTGFVKGPSPFMKTPVSVAHMPVTAIENSPSPDASQLLGKQIGVDLTTASMLFVTPATRGFNGSGNSRVNQFVDGMDNQAPGLNFFLGMFAMFPSMDFESMEILQGASSALYGSGGMNGTILINSKDPFKYPGFDIIARTGIMHVDKQQRNAASPYYDYSLRWAKSFKDKFAFKICAQYISGHDWLANDSTNYKRTGNTGNTIPGTRASDPNYDGVNVYGDETKLDLRMFLAGSLPPGHPLLKDPILVSRTGYDEKDIIDPITKNIKLSGAFHYKLTNKLEAQ